MLLPAFEEESFTFNHSQHAYIFVCVCVCVALTGLNKRSFVLCV